MIKEFIKDFTKWLLIKMKIDKQTHFPPLFNEAEIWWCSVGENVGSEISGKGEYFRRPMLVVRKLDRFSFIGVPITSQHKIGSWYSHIKVKEKDNYVVLHQIKHIDYRRMDKNICTIEKIRFAQIKDEIITLLRGE